MNILEARSNRPEAAEAWALSRGANFWFAGLAFIYWKYAAERGVDPCVAFAQACKETGFGRFGGVITEAWRNPCGLKTKNATGDAPEDHQRFPTWEQGIIAHLDHLALYAGALGYPRGVHTPDPRHIASLYGTAKTVESLGGRWAPDPNYGTSLRGLYVLPLLEFVYEPPAAPEYALKADVLDYVGKVAAQITGRVDFALDETAKLRTQDAEIVATLDRLAKLMDSFADAMAVHQTADQVRAGEVNERLLKLEGPLAAARLVLRSLLGEEA